jgi:hypothetical protein
LTSIDNYLLPSNRPCAKQFWAIRVTRTESAAR